MINLPLHHLIALVQFDQSFDAQQEQVYALQKEIAVHQARIQALHQETTDLQQQYLKNKSNVYQLEKKLDELSSERKLKEKKLSTIANVKEYSALEHNLTALNKEQLDIEPNLETAWQEQEQLAHDMLKLKNVHQQQREVIEASISALQHAISALHNQLQQKLTERSVLCASVPQELLDTYTSLQKKIKNPIVPLQNNTCSGCLYVVPSQKINNIFLYNLEQCNNCFRLLYAHQLV